ncbi:uncharacterized protein LOC143226748 [Tachypleus tridentatus]|uniref:uncharacterized protein LOC143226748 n=1 Tax=Tachypleus tridentatus TaxID=6853 RepID=UPI003FD049A4
MEVFFFVVFYMFAVIGMEIFKEKIQYFGYDSTLDPSLLYCGNPKLNNTSFYTSHYCSNNFNNIMNSMVVLFELMVVNQWHVLTSGFVLVTGKFARLYFFLFHLTCVIIVLNIFTAFVLEAFILEYSFSKSRLESALEKKIKEMGLQLGRRQSRVSAKTDKQDLVEENETELEVDSDHNPHFLEVDTSDSVPKRASAKLGFLEDNVRFHLSKNKNVENLLQRMFENELDVEDIGPADINDLDGEE